MKLFTSVNKRLYNKTIFITESQAFDLLLEAASLDDIHAKYYVQIPQDVFMEIIESDPTYNQNNSQKMGKFGKWLLSLYQNGNLKLEDLYKATEYLSYFIRFNAKIEKKDINQYKTLPELYGAVKPFMDNPEQAATKSEEVRNIKSGADKVYEDEKWLVVVPRTEEASCYYGKGTQWCTAADKSKNMFDYYNEQGPIYINILKGTNTKYQFHFEEQQFMDATNDPIKWPVAKTIGLTKKLLKFYVDKYGAKANALIKNVDPAHVTSVKGTDEKYFLYSKTYSILFEYDEEMQDYVPIKELDDNEWFKPNAICGRFIPKKTGYKAITDLYDIVNREFVFGDKYNISNITFPDGDNCEYIMCYLYDEDYDLKTSIFSLKDMRFTMNNVDYSSFMELSKYSAITGARQYYRPGLLVATWREYYGSGYVLLDADTGEKLTDSDYTVFRKEFVSLGYQIPVSLVFFVLEKSGRSYIILYDGTIMDRNEFVQNKNNIIAPYINDLKGK